MTNLRFCFLTAIFAIFSVGCGGKKIVVLTPATPSAQVPAGVRQVTLENCESIIDLRERDICSRKRKDISDRLAKQNRNVRVKNADSFEKDAIKSVEHDEEDIKNWRKKASQILVRSQPLRLDLSRVRVMRGYYPQPDEGLTLIYPVLYPDRMPENRYEGRISNPTSLAADIFINGEIAVQNLPSGASIKWTGPLVGNTTTYQLSAQLHSAGQGLRVIQGPSFTINVCQSQYCRSVESGDWTIPSY